MTYSAKLEELKKLGPDWNSYKSTPPTEAALETASYLTPCPLSNGGIQVEVHAGGSDIEIEIAPDGSITSVFWGKK